MATPSDLNSANSFTLTRPGCLTDSVGKSLKIVTRRAKRIRIGSEANNLPATWRGHPITMDGA